jgi:hypothetical protein
MTEEEARLELLKTEINAIQASIQNSDTIVFQIKGWCVTASLAIGGFAVSSHTPALTLLGIVAVTGFFLVNCQYKTIQRAFIRRNNDIDAEIKRVGIMQFLKGAGTLETSGAAVPDFRRAPDLSFRKKVYSFLSELSYEAGLANTFSLYLFLFVCLTVEAIILFA